MVSAAESSSNGLAGGKEKRWVLAFCNVIYACYIKVTINNIYGMCWLVLWWFFPSVHLRHARLQMGGILLAEHIHSMGGGYCASPQLNPFDMHGPKVRRRGCWSQWKLAQCWDKPSPEVCQHLTPQPSPL